MPLSLIARCILGRPAEYPHRPGAIYVVFAFWCRLCVVMLSPHLRAVFAFPFSTSTFLFYHSGVAVLCCGAAGRGWNPSTMMLLLVVLRWEEGMFEDSARGRLVWSGVPSRQASFAAAPPADRII